jgi:drug/metabolite transporter (DMT)-like permease
MWWLLAFLSAALLGCYDSFKKIALKGNAVIPVLFLNTVISAAIMSPFVFQTGCGGWDVQKWIVMKSALVLSSWVAGYYAMKHLPLTIVGPVNASRPVLVLIGAVLIFSERLNLLQGCGVVLALLALFLMKRTGEKEGIQTRNNRWVICLVLSVILGAASGLYDKFLMSPEHLCLDKKQVLGWYTLYQAGMMGFLLLVTNGPKARAAGVASAKGFRWTWAIPFISIFLCAADYAYLQALASLEALIAVVSMIRRGSVLVSFAIGALILHEKNLRSKALDLALLLASMVLLFLGSR